MQSFTYKQYFVIHENRDGKIEVTHTTADYNFTCFDESKLFDSIADVKRYIDEGHWDIGPPNT